MMLFATDITTYALFGAAILIGVAILYSAISTIANKGKPDPNIEELEREAQNDIVIDETHGTIVHMECGTVAGGKTSRTYKQFYIVFRDDFDNEKEFYISEDIYLSLDVNIPGTLATVGAISTAFAMTSLPQRKMRKRPNELHLYFRVR